jgi:hypothetical protein
VSSHRAEVQRTLDDVLARRRHFRIFRRFAMNRFAARLPLTNFTAFDFREVDRELERFERRDFFVTV